jgi:glycine oxidase
MKVVIVGGGIMGMSVAVELAGNGDEVTVLERSVPGAEASSAAAGRLAPQLESTGMGPMLELCLKSRELYAAWVRRIEGLSHVDVGYRESGVLEFGDAAKLEQTCRWQRAAGLRCELVQARALEPNAPDRPALHLPDDHQVDPPKLMRALAIAAAKAGATFRTGQVHAVAERSVDVDAERLSADAVVVAAGSWSSLIPGARIDARVLQPMRGQMVELRTRIPPFSATLASDQVYLVSRGDGRVILGSTMERAGFDKRVTAAGLAGILSAALRLCPALEGAEVHASWAGLRPWTEDQLPILGPGPLPGVLLATGHFRNGILLAPVTALLISQLLHGNSPAVDLSPFRYGRFPT